LIKAHWDVLASVEFTTVEVWTEGRLVTFYLLFVMEVATRRVHFAGYSVNPNETWMKQVARNLTDCEDGFLQGKPYLLMDRDGTICPAFRKMLKNEGIEPVLLPSKSPNLNALLSRQNLFPGQIRHRLILFTEQTTGATRRNMTCRPSSTRRYAIRNGLLSLSTRSAFSYHPCGRYCDVCR